MKTDPSTVITIVLRLAAAARAALLGMLLLCASYANLHAATFSDDNWTAMAGHAGANGPVRAAVVDGAGDLYIGGEFTAVGDLPANCVAKWNGHQLVGPRSGVAGQRWLGGRLCAGGGGQ